MQQLLHLFYRFNRGPHGNAVVAVLFGSFLIFGALLAGAAYEPLRAPAVAIAITAALVALSRDARRQVAEQCLGVKQILAPARQFVVVGAHIDGLFSHRRGQSLLIQSFISLDKNLAEP
jgi:hypothetical protein